MWKRKKEKYEILNCSCDDAEKIIIWKKLLFWIFPDNLTLSTVKWKESNSCTKILIFYCAYSLNEWLIKFINSNTAVCFHLTFGVNEEVQIYISNRVLLVSEFHGFLNRNCSAYTDFCQLKDDIFDLNYILVYKELDLCLIAGQIIEYRTGVFVD